MTLNSFIAGFLCRGHFRQRVFLARPQGLPPLEIAVHEEEILGGQNPGKQETRRAGPPGSAKAGMDGADGVGVPRRLCRRPGQGTRHGLGPERESETAMSVALPTKNPVSAVDVFCGRAIHGPIASVRSLKSCQLRHERTLYAAPSQRSDVGSIPIARSISLDDSIALTRLTYLNPA
jgi:hypothetical protein